MKKLLFAVLTVLTFGTASAQFKVTEKQKTPVRVWAAFGGHQALYYLERSNGEYYYFMAFNTSNQFDDRLIIHLGDLDTAKATLHQLEKDLHKEGEIYELTDDNLEKFSMQCTAFNQYRITKRGYAGSAYLTIGQVSKMLAALE